MKKALVLFGMLALAAPAHADMTHRISSSVQLNVQSAATQATRLGNSFSTSGSGVLIPISVVATAQIINLVDLELCLAELHHLLLYPP